MADVYVSSVDEFLNLTNTANDGDMIYVSADLDFTGRVFADALVTLPECVVDFQDHTLLNVVIRAAYVESLQVFVGMRDYSRRNIKIKNLAQMDIDINANNANVYVSDSIVEATNVKFSIRAECKSYSTFGNNAEVRNSAFLLSVYATSNVIGICNGTYVSNCRIGGKLYSRDGYVCGVGNANDIRSCVVKAILVSANGSSYGLSQGNGTGAVVRDCVIEGSIKGAVYAVGLVNLADVKRCIVRARLEGSAVMGMVVAINSFNNYKSVSDSLFDGKMYTQGGAYAITGSDDYRYVYNNFRGANVTLNDVLMTEENVQNGALVDNNDIDDIAFYRDVLGFDV